MIAIVRTLLREEFDDTLSYRFERSRLLIPA